MQLVFKIKMPGVIDDAFDDAFDDALNDSDIHKKQIIFIYKNSKNIFSVTDMFTLYTGQQPTLLQLT